MLLIALHDCRHEKFTDWNLASSFFTVQLSGKISTRLLALFFSQLAMALHSGVGLLEALEYMEREQSNERMRALLVRLKEGIMTGRLSLSVCGAKQPCHR